MKSVIDKINAAKSIAVMPHINEDPDALGSCFAFAKMMRKMGKEAVVYVSGKIEERLAFMCDEYVIYESGMGREHDLCACLDCGDLKRIGDRKELFDEIGNSINIDHHFTNTMFADANYVDGGASAAAEILTELFDKMQLSLDDDIAKDLYTAICSDTGCFKYSNVTPKTLHTTANLIEYDFDHAEVARLLFDTESLAAMRLKAEVSEKIQSFSDGKITLVTADEKDGEKYGIAPWDIPNLVEIPRRVAGTEIAVCIKKTENGYRINLRSNGKADVAAVASRLGGGGHVKAAGGTVYVKDMDEAVKIVIAECEKAVENI